jgi:hypothetical protein
MGKAFAENLVLFYNWVLDDLAVLKNRNNVGALAVCGSIPQCADHQVLKTRHAENEDTQQ